MGSMEFESHSWIWDGVYYYPHLFGGLMLTAALLGFSTSYFGGIGVPSLPYFWPHLGIFQKKKYEKKPVRVYMDGCFDLMHYGHANALRQAKALGDILVVGIVSDEEIIANKGPPVLSMEERLLLVSGLKWVDEVIANAPYAITEEFMGRLFSEHKIDYIVHGDDPCLLPDGTDAYTLAKKAGRYKQIKRTEGVSSTDIVGRILSLMRDTKVGDGCSSPSMSEQPQDRNLTQTNENQPNGAQISHFLPTSQRIVQFSNGKGPAPNARVVYIDGAFDLFHAGHVEITTFNISLVVHGTVAENNCLVSGDADPYAAPKAMGIFRMLDSPKDTTTTSVAKRIIANHEVYQKRNAKKTESEKRYYAEKKYVSGV
ncbi:ethanolamine-phosphate cytidylyltransferase-like isoform X2 [Telopea speciosissima]|uniref:ethanolamine-phosphate cytidylyltransferase-like isoform X2 n=1 Tax=Telopea speciosissima TaxID=54955 RepID=UPI001CC33B41|nr:ethanolamine-phosphate cytidylyltransferase-like isoform X2 [Telopea speciosissima]